MLPIQNRLRHRRDFSVVYQCGIRRNAAALGLRAYLRHQETAALPSRIGFSISLKVSKRAVVRNRIKRQLRAAFRHLLPRLKDGWDLIIVVRSEALQCDYLKFLQQLEQLLAQAEILNGN
jgi:ribonuclease P protein component